ncbi:TonB-dependent receptor [Algoriphagus confluentis]|uniref:Carboxypeptidase-like regulatory domain-containing protein n=1 Tax=Algoriphagus confluentis TaxID=1697556 RepID=A0ABQ6PMA1_9BACT|nr:carboxypeptidase-like regulatory domain-containing protein [Algoriphagus confluentis]
MKATKSIQTLTVLILLILTTGWLSSANAQQTVKGKIIDAQAEYPLLGATVIVLDSNPLVGTTSDENGNFKLENVPVGRQTLQVQYLGYTSITLPNVLVTAGKEVILDIKLEESLADMSEFVLTAQADKDLPINDMAKVSARTFSPEETTRFSGGRNDVSRLAASFAGVSAPDDSRNDIVVRGNSPSGLLWRINGLPVATTSHFATLGVTGGPVSALNPNILRTSDFITGAFPAEYGNANAAVFDVNFRNGNTDKFEFTGQLGAFTGAELMAEGPVNRKNQGSFVAAYRYGIASLAATGTSATPYYQDFNYKVNLGEGKLGKFELFGIVGRSSIDFLGDEIDETDLFADPNQNAYVENSLRIFGLAHTLRLGRTAYLKTTLGSSSNENSFYQDNLIRDEAGNQINSYRAVEVENQENRYTLSMLFNKKFNAKWSLRAGYLGETYNADFLLRDRDNRVQIPDEDGDGIPDYFLTLRDVDEWFMIGQNYVQAEYRVSEKLTTTFGLHSQFMNLNNDFVVEPRAAVSYEYKPGQKFSFAYGMHSQQVPFPILFLEEEVTPGNYQRTNLDLDFMRSQHYVLAYDRRIGLDWRVKAEAYYQSLRNIPVEVNPSSYSVINEGADFGFDERAGLVSEGVGENYGVELTIEKFFSNNYYLMSTLSLYNSTYEGSDGIERNTAFNNGFVYNFLAGKEWAVGATGKNSITFDTKFTTAGGRPFTPIDLESTIENGGREVFFEDQAFSQQLNDYMRWDVKVGFRINSSRKKVSHQFFLDLQNVTNRENDFAQRYSPTTNQINTVTQIGFFPDVMYRIQF